MFFLNWLNPQTPCASSIFRLISLMAVNGCYCFGFTFCSDTIIFAQPLTVQESLRNKQFVQTNCLRGWLLHFLFVIYSDKKKKRKEKKAQIVFPCPLPTLQCTDGRFCLMSGNLFFSFFLSLKLLEHKCCCGGRSQENLLDLFLYRAKCTTGPCAA